MICPKCGRPVKQLAVICPGCDFILDTSFLGDEVLDEERSLRPGPGGIDPEKFNLADAVILGDIDNGPNVSFETADSGFHIKESTGARLYVSGQSKATLAPDAIPAIKPEMAKNARLTPFERHVMTFIDGERPVESIRVDAGLDDSEVKTALATLADKGIVEVIGRALVDLRGLQISGPRRKKPARLPSGLVPIGSPQDDTDLHLDAAFQTAGRIDLGSLSMGQLSDIDEDSDMADGDHELSPEYDQLDEPSRPAFEQPTNEIRPGTPYNSAPSHESAESETVIRENGVLGNSVSFSSSIGGAPPEIGPSENFDGPTNMVGPYQRGSSGVDPMMNGISQLEDDVGTAAIQQIANSQLGRALDGDGGSRTQKRKAAPTGRRNIGYSSLFGEEVGPEDAGGAPNPSTRERERHASRSVKDIIRSSDETPNFRPELEPDGEPPASPTRQIKSLTGSRISMDDFSGDEYSDEMGLSIEGVADDLSSELFHEPTSQRRGNGTPLTFSESSLNQSADQSSQHEHMAIGADGARNGFPEPPTAPTNTGSQADASDEEAERPPPNPDRPRTRPVASLLSVSAMNSVEYIDEGQIIGTRRLAPLSAESVEAPSAGVKPALGTSRGQARALYGEALVDKADGKLSRARMNAKLAAVMDPSNDVYRDAVAAWAQKKNGTGSGDEQPEEVHLYERAQAIEETDVDTAIELLQEGIALNPSVAAFHNRLGVVLALKKGEFSEAARCVRRAVTLEPDNLHYKSNLGKIEKKAQQQDRNAAAR